MKSISLSSENIRDTAVIFE